MPLSSPAPRGPSRSLGRPDRGRLLWPEAGSVLGLNHGGFPSLSSEPPEECPSPRLPRRRERKRAGSDADMMLVGCQRGGAATAGASQSACSACKARLTGVVTAPSSQSFLRTAASAAARAVAPSAAASVRRRVVGSPPAGGGDGAAPRWRRVAVRCAARSSSASPAKLTGRVTARMSPKRSTSAATTVSEMFASPSIPAGLATLIWKLAAEPGVWKDGKDRR